MPTCIYCQTENNAPSIEHVIAEALGGCLKLPADAVCKPCNNRILGDQIDVPVRADLEQLLVDHGVVGKSGEAATMIVTHADSAEGERRYLVSKDEIGSAEKRKLVSHAGSPYRFRAASPEELERARADIQAKNPGRQVVLGEIEERLPDVPDGHFCDVDFGASHWSRWAAKTCLNLIAFAWGSDAARSADFDPLRAHVCDSGPIPVGLAFGGCGSGTANTDETPGEHHIELKAENGRVVVKMTAFDFCGFKYEGQAPSLTPLARRIVLDATNAKIACDVTA